MTDDRPEPTEFNVIQELPDTPVNRVRMAKHVEWLMVKHRMNRSLAGLGPLTMTYTEPDPSDDSGADTPDIVQTLISH